MIKQFFLICLTVSLFTFGCKSSEQEIKGRWVIIDWTNEILTKDSLNKLVSEYKKKHENEMDYPKLFKENNRYTFNYGDYKTNGIYKINKDTLYLYENHFKNTDTAKFLIIRLKSKIMILKDFKDGKYLYQWKLIDSHN